MTVAEWIGVIALVLTLIGMAVSFNKEIQASELRSKMAIEDVVKTQEEKFVEVKVCKIVHTNAEKEYAELNKKIDDLKQDVKKLLAKAGIS